MPFILAKSTVITAMQVMALALLIATASADTRHRICIGEKACSVSVPSLYPCGTTVDAAAHELCAVHEPSGTVNVYPWDWTYQGSHEGDQCGYTWGVITCLAALKTFLPQRK